MTAQRSLPESNIVRCGFAALATLSFSTLTLIGCGEEDAPPPVAYTPPPAPEPPPPEPESTVKSIAELMRELNIDPKVDLPEERAPDTTEERVAVLLFWNAFAKSDSEYASSQMCVADKRVMEQVTKSGAWGATTPKIESIEVQCADDSDGFATLGLITAGDSEQPLLWDATVSESGGATFTAFPGTPDILDHLSGEDWIDAWKKYINGLFDKYANLPDEEVVIPQTDVQLADNGDAPQSAPEGGGGEGGGPGGGGAPMRKRPGAPVRGPEGPSPGGN